MSTEQMIDRYVELYVKSGASPANARAALAMLVTLVELRARKDEMRKWVGR